MGPAQRAEFLVSTSLDSGLFGLESRWRGALRARFRFKNKTISNIRWSQESLKEDVEVRTSTMLTNAKNAFPALIEELAYGGELADVEVGELERQVAAAAAGAVVENKVRQGRFPRHFATQR